MKREAAIKKLKKGAASADPQALVTFHRDVPAFFIERTMTVQELVHEFSQLRHHVHRQSLQSEGLREDLARMVDDSDRLLANWGYNSSQQTQHQEPK